MNLKHSKERNRGLSGERKGKRKIMNYNHKK